MKTVTAISALCAIAVIVPAVFGQDKPREREISVVGRGSITVIPDKISFQVGVESNGPSVEVVRRDSDAKTNALLKALKDAGVPDRDIVTTNSTLRKSFTSAEQSQTKREGTTYTFSRDLLVTLQKIDGADGILAALLKVGANTVSDLTFIDSKRSEHRDGALALAAADAVRLADFLAGQFGVKRGKVLTISPDESQEVLTVLRKSVGGATSPGQSEIPAGLSSGEMKVEASVTTRFALE